MSPPRRSCAWAPSCSSSASPYYRALGLDPDELFAADFRALREGRAYRTLQRYLRDGGEIAKVADPRLREQLLRARELDRQLADTGELEALLAGLAGRFVAPGPGGDPIRNPQVPSGRNLFAFEADKVPTRAAYEAGAEAFGQLLESYRAEHQGRAPEKLAFSLWSSETMRHLGIVESQALHALGLRPRWDAGGRLLALDIVPAAELGRPRVDVVLQVTSVYRDQFDGFMRLLAEAIERLAALDEPGNPLARNSQALERRLRERGVEAPLAQRLSRLRLFGNAPGDYGTGVTQLTLDSTRWDDDSALAEQFLRRLQYAYGSRDWGVKLDGGNLFAEQLKGVQAAILSRSSTLNGVLSTDHPFEYLGGLSLAVRHLDGASPALYIADLRQRQPRTTAAAQFLASELRGRYLSPQWIAAMQREGYAGSLEMLDLANNLWGWQAADRTMVRADQWQALHDTFVMDRRELGLAAWFETHNPTAQAQIIARMAEAIRKGYWDASEQTRRELAERWRQLAAAGAGEVGAATTREFIERMAGGFGEAAAQAEGAAASGAGGNGQRPRPRRSRAAAVRRAAAVAPAGRRRAARAVRRRRRPAIRSQSSSDGKSLMNGLETSLYELTRLFLQPVLLLILAALAYAFVALGGFAMEAWQRRRGRYRSRLAAWQALHGGNSDDLELWIMQRLEWLRITSRSAPMLGLVATMIPMGPALLALTRNDAQGIGENLVVAFSAVILALVAASITFFILTVRRRWLLQELRAVERAREAG